MDININGLLPQQLNQVLTILQTKHTTVANNIANTNTPGYIRQVVDFKQELSNVLDKSTAMISSQYTEENNLPGINPVLAQEIEVQEDLSAPARTDGNNVNLEQEMVDLSQTNQIYSTLSKLASKNLKLYSYVIKGGR